MSALRKTLSLTLGLPATILSLYLVLVSHDKTIIMGAGLVALALAFRGCFILYSKLRSSPKRWVALAMMAINCVAVLALVYFRLQQID